MDIRDDNAEQSNEVQGTTPKEVMEDEQETVPKQVLDDSSQPTSAQSGSRNITVERDGDSGLSDDLEDQDIDPYADEGDFQLSSAQRKKKNKKTKKNDKKKKSYANAAEPKPLPSVENRLGAASPIAGRTRDKRVKRNITLDFTLQ